MKSTATFGLIGKSLKHSFSKHYFTQKFQTLGLPFTYELFELDSIQSVSSILQNPNVMGLNVTIPYKTEILRWVDERSPEVVEIGAANVLAREGSKWVAYNTDAIGFQKSFLSFVPDFHRHQAIILGNGGAAKAVAYALERIKVPYVTIARNPQKRSEVLWDAFPQYAKEYKIWIQTTPVGMYPNTEACLDLDFSLASCEHYLMDLIYNPEETLFLRKGKAMGAKTQNGLPMLYAQADAAYAIWRQHVIDP